MNLKNLSTETLFGFLIPLAVFVAIIAVVPLIIMPQLNRISSASKQIQERQNRVDRLKNKIDTLQSIDTDSLKEKLNNVEIALPTGKGLAPLIEGIKSLAAESGLILNSMKLNPGKIATASATKAETPTPTGTNQSATKIVPSRFDLLFTVDLKGDFAGFQKFLDLVQKAKRIMIVVDFSATPAVDGVSFNLTMNAPFRSLENNSADIASEDLPTDTDQTKATYKTLQDNFVEYSRPVPGEVCDGCVGIDNPFP